MTLEFLKNVLKWQMPCTENAASGTKDHKTFSHHGHANLCFDESLKAWEDIHVKCARNQAGTGGEGIALFFNWRGANQH
ncbi:unnamed protein product [Pocillopora meandrina]|uniref:Uncharacterized protein n=1 Tax=Pocillopora meandrina TaxID=46732 RepID=A0AAU9XB35_9CNID|nr:unnamed protein product [Pocillopora meandrina]